MRAAVALVIVVGTLIDVRTADACSVSAAPDAHVFGRPDKTERGHRPWIRLWMVKPNEGIQLSLVDAACAADKVCAKGKPVPFERSDRFVRPKKALPPGARVQVVMGKTLLEDFTVTTSDAASATPAWDGTTAPIGKMAREELCAPAGPQITLKVKPTKADLADAVLVVWLRKPDAKKPLPGVAAIYSLGSEEELDLRNGFGSVWLQAMPKTIWTAISDGDGNLGPIVEHKL